MQVLPKPIENLINEFQKLPGIGQKSAERLAFAMLSENQAELDKFASALTELKKSLKQCKECFHITTKDVCEICTNKNRDTSTICVVSHPLELIAIEKTGSYNGLYHVLHGNISPIDNMGPENIKLKELKTRITSKKISEVIVATNPTLEGEATAMHIEKLIRPLDIKVTRIARGLPTGGDLEYADEQTLTLALKGRREA